ncbi:ABC transporter substrate-binding protein [Collinsella sp. AGMB00827]|uniref:ABC transporter substrate-binding protein n=1 Tax=Collinsella ureilytica TaxID=2869515 RepID=A0ABS7MJD1_9ACTN|nr:ABC transporter substrate-binding protein [Collinsella urealyticum]
MKRKMKTNVQLLKRILVVGLALLVALVALPGCMPNKQEHPGSGSGGHEQTSTRVITDAAGREVELPARVEKIVPLGNTPRMIVYLGLAKKAVGIGGLQRENITPLTAYAYATKDLWADLTIVGTDAAGATDYYPEQIMSVQPDVILCTYTAELADEIQSKTGIPTVAVPQGTLYQKDYEQAFRLIGEVCDVKDRAEEVITYISESLADLNKRTSNVPDAEKPSVLGAAATFKGPHGIDGVYIDYPVFTAIHAKSVADGLKVSGSAIATIVDKEQILGWDPDILFLDAGNLKLVRKDLAENPDFYTKLSAYNSGEIYQYPNSTSYFSNVEISIANSYYVGSIIYPEQFRDVDVKKKASEIFEFFLGDPDYLSKLKEAGYGYGKVEL